MLHYFPKFCAVVAIAGTKYVAPCNENLKQGETK